MRIAASVPPDVAAALRSIWGPLERYAHPSVVNLASRRMTRASPAVEGSDLVTLAQVQTLIAGSVTDDDPAAPVDGAIRVGAYATRGSSAAHRGELFAASDRGPVTWASTGTAWVYLAGVEYGLLSPDGKPTLTTDDVGYRFFSTDFNREFRWTGSAWLDTNPDQLIVMWRDSASVSGGWALCDGSNVTRSTQAGATTSYTTPDLLTDNRFIRAAAAAGGTGGAATVDPPATTSGAPSATVEVQAGTGETVATDDHTHDTNLAALAILPPYHELVPMVRL